MEVRELYQLCIWFETYVEPVAIQYQRLQKKLTHNATQAQKQPLRGDLTELLQTLQSMPMHELTAEQLDLIYSEDVDLFIGPLGAQNAARITKSARFDAASAQKDFSQIHQTVRHSLQKMAAVKEGLSKISYFEIPEEDHFKMMTVRIHFKESAAISDVVEWKNWSEEWYDIARGIALCVNEPPEDIKVLGAHQGSVIMVLGATAAVTSLLVLISKHLTKIALNGLQVANAFEDFKHKTKLNKTTIESIQKSIETLEKDALKTLLSEAKESLPSPIDGEQENALKKSIEKYLTFTKKGGEVDFISPPEPDEFDEEDGDRTEAEIEQIISIRNNIDEIRNGREETRLLAHNKEEEGDFEDEDLEDSENL